MRRIPEVYVLESDKPEKREALISSEMFAYVAAYILKRMAEESGDVKMDAKDVETIERHILETGQLLNVKMRKDSEAFAEDLLSAYVESVRAEVEHEYDGDDYDDNEWKRERIVFDPMIREIWMNAVRTKLTIHMAYDSETSGRTERFVDPIRTSSPYGIAYCHLRKEERTFRFDRVLSLEVKGPRKDAKKK